jgi:hypothetical protein
MTSKGKMKNAFPSIYKTFTGVSLSFLFLMPFHVSSLRREGAG